MSVLVGQLGGLSLGSGQPFCDAPFSASVLGEALPAPGNADVHSALSVVWSCPLVAADLFHGKGLGCWRNSLRRGACCHAALGTCSQGAPCCPPGLLPFLVAVVPERTGGPHGCPPPPGRLQPGPRERRWVLRSGSLSHVFMQMQALTLRP